MALINSTLASVLPLFPKWLIRPFASPYVAGETVETAINQIRKLNDQGFSATVDILGEHVQITEEANTIRDAYRGLYDHLAEKNLDCTISLKLTHLGLEISPQLARENVFAVVEKARQYNIGLTIDMEKSLYTDVTLQIYLEAIKLYEKVGTVLQAYLHRSLDDLMALNSPHLHLRVCKGIYRESPDIAFQDEQEIRDNFTMIAQALLKGPGFAALATHDLKLIDSLESWIENEMIPKDRFEFQVLFGVPMGDRLEQLKRKGYKVRVYVPFGETWYDYSIRRLKENPNIVGYVLGNMFKR